LGTSLLSSILTNNAAAALMYPIAMDAVDQTGTDRLKMAIIVMLASSDYMTSFGYQTNLMVYAPGGYKNIDFLKFGGPMQFLLWITSVALVAINGPLVPQLDYLHLVVRRGCSNPFDERCFVIERQATTGR
jgi:di/tricarboxylate transporter